MESNTYTAEDINLFAYPARILIAGFSNSGKSYLCTELIRENHSKFDKILYCSVSNHELEHDKEISGKLTVSHEILDPFEYVEGDNQSILLVLDDCFLEAIENKAIVNAFTKGRHKRISILFLSQNMYANGKFSRSIALNCSHFILMKIRDLSQVELLGRQIYGKKKASEFVDIYKKALSYQKFGHLLVDLAPHTPEILQLRTNITSDIQRVFTFS